MANMTPFLGQRPSPAGEELLLPKPPGVIRQFWARHPWWADSIVAGIYLIPTSAVTFVFLPRRIPAGFGVPLFLAVCIVAAALLFRRHRPWAVLAIVWGTTLAIALFADNVDMFAIPFALYTVAVYRSTRDAWVGLAGSAAVGVVAAILASGIHRIADVMPPGATPTATSTQFIVFMLVATLIGINIGNRKRYVAALIDRAAQLVRERDQQAQLAAAAERARIAREMHDIVSHSLTVMVSLADGSAAAVHGSPERAGDAMRQVAETGRHALTDMRRMLGVLNDASADRPASPAILSPQPGTDDLARLVETFRRTGLPVRFTATGIPPADPGQQLTVYRIVQESLTNALRHAADTTHVTVEAVYTPEIIRVTTEDDGHAVATSMGGAGRGLVGMRERVALYGGSVRSGPRESGGWRVAAEFAPETGTPTNGDDR
jgi:signal transduction histidine kinase